MNMNQSPDPEFVGNLERELRSTLRRQSRFDDGKAARRGADRGLYWKTGVFALVAMCLGSAGTFAVTSRMRARTAELIVARAEAQSEFAEALLGLYSEDVQEAEARFAAGVVTVDEVESIRLERSHLESNAARLALDVEETRISGREPDNALSAPVLRSRDFVSERMELQRGMIQAQLSFMENQASARGADSNDATSLTLQCESARTALSVIERRLALRREFVAGERTAREVVFAEMKVSSEPQQALAVKQAEELEGHLKRMQALFDQGMVTRSEVRDAEVAYRGAQLQVKLAELEMQIIEARLNESPAP